MLTICFSPPGSHQLFVPCLVGGRPSVDVFDNIDDEKEDEEKGTGYWPHDLPVPVGTMTKHVFNVFFKPKMSRQHMKINIIWQLVGVKAELMEYKCGYYRTQIHKPFKSIDVTDSYDLNEDDEQQGECGSIVVEYGKPVISRCSGEAQAKQQTEHTH